MQLTHYSSDGEHWQQLWPHLLARPEGVCIVTLETDKLQENKPVKVQNNPETTVTAMQLSALKLIRNVVWSKFWMDIRSRTLGEE